MDIIKGLSDLVIIYLVRLLSFIQDQMNDEITYQSTIEGSESKLINLTYLPHETFTLTFFWVYIAEEKAYLHDLRLKNVYQ